MVGGCIGGVINEYHLQLWWRIWKHTKNARTNWRKRQNGRRSISEAGGIAISERNRYDNNNNSNKEKTQINILATFWHRLSMDIEWTEAVHNAL